ncbi:MULTISPECIES: limonene-1,2-epoxide hydrolase family protein [Protofrankia]|uniref:limonene-1,2-epoxide hydrolase family protein n=1 Tax=Protofrankia TaxID=2994361 RepID=UPI0006994867|nr:MULTISPECIES: limonene-1,2-epoxide hydrolase family protein [Protofrankia]ONH32050.1 hypothetical protein BL254_22310 [Protofrankia sp. BMG5.30]
MSHITIVENFFKRWSVSYDELTASFTDTFTAETPWLAAPVVPETHGPAEAIALLEQFRAGYNLATIQVHIKRIGQTGDVVWTERVDDVKDADGNLVVSIPVAGVLTLNDDGKITSYRDYCDLQELQAKAAA